MDALFSLYEATISAPHAGDAAPLDRVLAEAGTALTGVLTAERVRVTVVVEADSLGEAALLGCLGAGAVADLPGAEIESVRLLPA